MKKRLVAISILVAAAFCWGQESPPPKVETAYFYIGGHNGPSFHVNIR